MSKQHIHILVDSSIYLSLKSKNINISGLVNELLRNFVNQEEIMTDEAVILDNISDIKSKVNELNDRLKTEIVKLQVVKSKQEEEKKAKDQQMKMFVSTMQHNNPLKEVFDE